MASPVYRSSLSRNGAFPFPGTSAAKINPSAAKAMDVPSVTALSVEFVAKPQQAHRVQSTIPAALAGALKDIAGFAGSLVMVSDQEARLVTVVTLWAGDERARRCAENARWVHKLLAPYLDRCLRVQTLVAHLSVLSLIQPETNGAGECSMRQHVPSEEENVCVA